MDIVTLLSINPIEKIESFFSGYEINSSGVITNPDVVFLADSNSDPFRLEIEVCKVNSKEYTFGMTLYAANGGCGFACSVNSERHELAVLLMRIPAVAIRICEEHRDSVKSNKKSKVSGFIKQFYDDNFKGLIYNKLKEYGRC